MYTFNASYFSVLKNNSILPLGGWSLFTKIAFHHQWRLFWNILQLFYEPYGPQSIAFSLTPSISDASSQQHPWININNNESYMNYTAHNNCPSNGSGQTPKKYRTGGQAMSSSSVPSRLMIRSMYRCPAEGFNSFIILS